MKKEATEKYEFNSQVIFLAFFSPFLFGLKKFLEKFIF